MPHQSSSYHAIVLKKSSFGEADRMVTLLSQEYGKQTVVARSAQKLTSSRLAALEPGSFVKAFTMQHKGMPLLTQTVLIDQAMTNLGELGRIRALTQWLEMMDALFVEEAVEGHIFTHVLESRHLVLNSNTSLPQLRQNLVQLLQNLGFADETTDYEQSITQLVETIADRPMRGYSYLTVR